MHMLHRDCDDRTSTFSDRDLVVNESVQSIRDLELCYIGYCLNPELRSSLFFLMHVRMRLLAMRQDTISIIRMAGDVMKMITAIACLPPSALSE